MSVPEKIAGLVLAGGRSRRMGSDKASLRRGGKTQLERAVGLLAEQLDEVFVSTRRDQADDPVRRDFAQIVDRYDNLGPLAGILSAMHARPDLAWLVLACDLPNVDAETIRFLLENASASHPMTAYRSVHDGLPEPLCAVFRPGAREPLEGFVGEGIICPRKIMIRSRTHLLAQPNPSALHNVNSPADLAGTGIELAS